MGEWFYALSLDGWLWRSKDSTVPFEPGPRLGGLPNHVRHMAVLSQEDRPCLAWSVIGDCPERIFLGKLNADGDWSRWSVQEVQEVLRPECDWEGADQPLTASQVGMVTTRVNQLRDTAFYREDGVTYLAYSIAGEAGLALARLNWEV